IRCDSAVVRRDLPMPGSPETSTTRPSPDFACCQRRVRRSSSSSRPTSGVVPERNASKRLTTPLSPATRQAGCGSAKPASLELGPVGCDQQHRQVRDPLDRKVEHLARGPIDPMQVLKDHQYRLSPRQRLELAQQCRQCPLLLALRAEVERREPFAAGKRQHLGDQREIARLRPVPEQRLQLVEPCCGRVVAAETCGALQLADKGVQRTILIVRRTKIAQSRVRLALDMLRQRRGQPRLANARLTGDQHQPPVTALRLLPAPQQKVELLVAADQRRDPRTQCLKAADDPALAEHTPGWLWFAKTGKRLRPEILDLEQRADLSPGAVGNDQGAGPGQRLQAGGEVWRLADDAALLRGTGA